MVAPMSGTAKTKIELLDVARLSFDRTDFGTAPLPLWYPLNEFDRFALDLVDAARKDDPDALLALGLFASGDVRTMQQYEKCKMRVDGLVEQLEPVVGAERSVEGKGKAIFLAMCREFYRMNKKGELRGYSFDESRLSASFSAGTFNCVSSAMLYIILTRHFGLASFAVELPSHVFAMLEKPDGTGIDIETTSGRGFGVEHDKAFFDSQSSDWFEDRGLERATYDDYLRRRIHTPLAFVTQNMRNQHTSLKRMPPFDRHRLLEARGFIMPAIRSAAESQLTVYLAEFSYLSYAEDSLTLSRFAATVAPAVTQLVQLHGDDSLMAELMAAAKPMALHLADIARHGRPVCTDADRILATQDRSRPASAFTLQTLLAVLGPCLDGRVQRGTLDSALALLDRVDSLGDFEEQLTPYRYNLCNAGIQRAWERRDYREAIRACSLALHFAPTHESREKSRRNLEAAYCNLAAQHANAGRIDDARAVLRECLDEVSEADNCRQRLQQIEEAVGTN